MPEGRRVKGSNPGRLLQEANAFRSQEVRVILQIYIGAIVYVVESLLF